MGNNDDHIDSLPRLLILDDDVMIGDTISRIGEFSGFQCKHTASPSEFFEWVQSWKPHVLALDLLMPDMDGLEVIAKLSDQHCDARLIITSGVGDRVLDAAYRSASEHGLNTLGILAKPFSTANLRALLDQVAQPSGRRDRATYHTVNPTLQDLKQAIESEQITVAYQPKVYCRTGTLAGFEALARWNWNGQWVPPDTFIAMAEAHGLVDDLTQLIVEQSLTWLVSISQHPLCELPILRSTTLSINISARSLTNQDLLRWIVQRCDELNVARHRVIFELTESSATSEFVTALDTLTRLRLQGFHLSIDDFGTGYSSMMQLVRLPFSEIKIDKSFVMANRDSNVSSAVVRSIIDLGRSLHLLSTAEGVEDAATLEFLKGLGCDLAQGYYIAKPMTPEMVLPWLQQRESNRELSRLESVKKSALFGSAPERNIDRVTRLAARLLDMPIALVTILDRDSEWFKSSVGMSITQLPRKQSFCTHTIEYDDMLIVQDTLHDERFQYLDSVRGNDQIRFYAGQPLCLPNGDKVGALCILDRQPRTLSAADIRVLKGLAAMVELEFTDKLAPVHSPLPVLVEKEQFLLRARYTLEFSAVACQEATLFYLSLDNLGHINRRHGRATGDHCLQWMADTVIDFLDASDLIGRYRGAEIVILRTGKPSHGSCSVQEALAFRLEKLSQELSIPVHALFASVPLTQDPEIAFGAAIEQARAIATAISTDSRGSVV